MSDVPRRVLAGLLEDLIPKTWTIVLSERAVDQSGTVLFLQQRKIERHPSAGTGVHLITFQCTVTVDGQDPEKAEDRLDDEVTALVQSLDAKNLGWDAWEKVTYHGSLGYQANVQLQAQKEL